MVICAVTLHFSHYAAQPSKPVFSDTKSICSQHARILNACKLLIVERACVSTVDFDDQCSSMARNTLCSSHAYHCVPKRTRHVASIVVAHRAERGQPIGSNLVLGHPQAQQRGMPHGWVWIVQQCQWCVVCKAFRVVCSMQAHDGYCAMLLLKFAPNGMYVCCIGYNELHKP